MSIDFNRKQLYIIGDALAKPGHGFASSRALEGIGMSDDMLLMISEEDHASFVAPFMTDVGKDFKGAVFHSCGDWSSKIGGIKAIVINARMVGDADTVMEKIEKFNKPGVKLIAVTYCRTPEEQNEVYNRIKDFGE